jgi:hypothetical protein
LSENVFKVLVPFYPTYLYEAGFLAMTSVKTKKINQLHLDACDWHF